MIFNLSFLRRPHNKKFITYKIYKSRFQILVSDLIIILIKYMLKHNYFNETRINISVIVIVMKMFFVIAKMSYLDR